MAGTSCVALAACSDFHKEPAHRQWKGHKGILERCAVFPGIRSRFNGLCSQKSSDTWLLILGREPITAFCKGPGRSRRPVQRPMLRTNSLAVRQAIASVALAGLNSELCRGPGVRNLHGVLTPGSDPLFFPLGTLAGFRRPFRLRMCVTQTGESRTLVGSRFLRTKPWPQKTSYGEALWKNGYLSLSLCLCRGADPAVSNTRESVRTHHPQNDLLAGVKHTNLMAEPPVSSVPDMLTCSLRLG